MLENVPTFSTGRGRGRQIYKHLKKHTFRSKVPAHTLLKADIFSLINFLFI